MVSDRHYPGKPRFTTIKTIVKVHARAEYPDRCIFDTRYFISSAARNIDRIAAAVRANKSKGSVKTRRKKASWNPTFLLELLQLK